MATTLFKLVMDATTTTDTNPEVEKYFYNLEEVDRDSGIITIPYNKFFDDAGNSLTTNLTTVASNNGYYLLFVNGVLQQSSLFTVSSEGSTLEITNASSVPVSAPINLIVNNFAPTSDTIITS
jgi:hypothetical protein